MTLSTTLRALALALPLLAGHALAHEGIHHDGCPSGQSFMRGAITVSGAFTRATLPNAPVGAGYLTITNAGDAADRLVSIKSEVTPTVELHTMSHEGGMMKMEQLKDGIEIPAGGTVSLEPGGLHIMFIGPDQPFKEGECVEAVLTFETAGELPVQISVGPVGARQAPDGHAH